MRLNRGTLVLLVASVVVILAVLLLNNQPASAPAPTPEATAEGAGPVFPDLTQDEVVRVEASSGDGAQKTVLTKDDGGAWTVAEATNASALATDQTKVANIAQTLATLVSTDRFALGEQQAADFGLDAPTHTFVLTDSDNQTHTLKIGSKSPTTPRYYTFVNDNTATVYVVQQSTVDDLVNQTLTLPPYVASPTPTVTPTATLNPFSEQELATQTAQAIETFMAQLTATAESTVEATGEATAEATATPAP